MVVMDQWGSLWGNVFRAETHSWWGWRQSGGGLVGSPNIAVDANGKAWVVVRSSFNALWLTSLAPTGFSGSWTILRIHWGVSANQEGSFRFSGLSDGAYNLCVQAPTTVWLDPCEWGLPIPSAALIATQRSQAVTITLTKGVEVPITIVDPAQHLLANEGKTVGAHLLVGVRTSANTFRPAIFTARDVTGRAVKVVIPFDKTVTLEIASSFFKLAVNDSVLSKPGTTVPLNVPSGQKPPTINVSVTGRN